MADHNDFGKLAEELAEQFLVEKNYKILAKTFVFKKRK
jgi:putative endonuclease